VFVQVRGLQTAANDPEPSLITSEWHILCHMARGQAVCSFWIRRSSVRAWWRKQCFRRSAACARPRELPEPPLSSGPVAHLWHIVTDPQPVPCAPAQFRWSRAE